MFVTNGPFRTENTGLVSPSQPVGLGFKNRPFRTENQKPKTTNRVPTSPTIATPLNSRIVWARINFCSPTQNEPSYASLPPVVPWPVWPHLSCWPVVQQELFIGQNQSRRCHQ